MLLEFALNTQGDPAAYERLLRQILAIRPAVAVIAVNIHKWRPQHAHGQHKQCSTIDIHAQPWHDADEDAILKLCQHYMVPWCPYALHSWTSCAPVMRREPHTPLGGCVLHQSSLCMGLGAVPYLLLEQGLLPSQLPGELVRRAAPRRSGAAGGGDQPVSRAGCAHS